MNEIFTDFSANYFNFERPQNIAFALAAIIFLLLEFFPGRRLTFPLIKLKRFIDPHLIKYLISTGEKKQKQFIRTGIVGIVWILLILALANPRWDFTDIQAFRPNINLVFLVDVSKSMDANDEKPSRLERAKQEIKDVVKNIDAVNYGLVVFAEQASVISPLTDDKNAIEYYVPTISTDLVGIQGSNIKAGVDVANSLLSNAEGSVNYIVLMSDGGFQDKSQISAIKEKIKNTKIFAFAFGTPQGSPVELGDGRLLKDDGRIVIAKLEADNLLQLCGKNYVFKSTYLDDDIRALKAYIDKDIAVQKSKYQSLRVWNDRFYLPLVLALIILALFFRKGSVFPVILVLLIPSESFAESGNEYLKFDNIFSLNFFRNKDQRAYHNFKKGEYRDSVKGFSSDYNKGVALYRLRDFEAAEERFKKDKSLDSLYNLGNAQLSKLKAEDAIKTYGKVLKLDPANKDAAFNLDLAKKLLSEQKRNKNRDQNQEQQGNNKQSESLLKNPRGEGEGGSGKSDDSDDDSDMQVNPTKSGSEFGSKSEISGKNFDNQLKIEAQNLFSKISGDPASIIKSRIAREQSKKAKSSSQNSKPW